jgi:two-component system, OmpR family, response regulator
MTASRAIRETLLIVDDSRASLNVLGQRFGRLGYMVVLSDNGQQALERIGGAGFDLVLLDMMMPGLGGLQVLRELRGARESVDLPVVMFTGRGDPLAAVEALSAGADDYVAKPFAFEVLAARVERVLARAARLRELKRANAALDARIAARAIELGEMRGALAASLAEQDRLTAQLRR